MLHLETRTGILLRYLRKSRVKVSSRFKRMSKTLRIDFVYRVLLKTIINISHTVAVLHRVQQRDTIDEAQLLVRTCVMIVEVAKR